MTDNTDPAGMAHATAASSPPIAPERAGHDSIAFLVRRAPACPG